MWFTAEVDQCGRNTDDGGGAGEAAEGVPAKIASVTSEPSGRVAAI